MYYVVPGMYLDVKYGLTLAFGIFVTYIWVVYIIYACRVVGFVATMVGFAYVI